MSWEQVEEEIRGRLTFLVHLDYGRGVDLVTGRKKQAQWKWWWEELALH